MRPIKRRTVLSGATSCAVALAGCTTSGGGDDQTETDRQTTSKGTTTTETATTTPEPAVFEVIDTTQGTYEAGSEWPLEFTVANHGEQAGTFSSTLQYSKTGDDWSDVVEITLNVPVGGTETYSREFEGIDTAGTAYFRLTGTDAEWTIQFSKPTGDVTGRVNTVASSVELVSHSFQWNQDDNRPAGWVLGIVENGRESQQDFQMGVNFMDDSGTVFEENYATLTNIKPGQRAEFTVAFYSNAPDRLSKYSITVEAWQA